MKNMPLGRTGLTVPQICLGTMTWGEKNTEAEGHAQIDYALDHGVNFLDAAEMYPVMPTRAETQGDTERVIGTWLARHGGRDRLIIATKCSGQGIPWVRDGAPMTGASIREAVEGSLKRLQTDVIDLYQLHWPNRGHYHFRAQWAYDPTGQDTAAVRQNIADILGALGREVDAGRIRAIGLSNETTWGTLQFLRIAEAEGLPRVATVQNEYSLLYRTYDLDMAEMSHHEDVGLLSYTSLAGGILSTKYTGGAKPEGSRYANPESGTGRLTPIAIEAADAYGKLARDHGLDPVQMAYAFCLTRPFMTSVIVGATSVEQLAAGIGSAEVTLSDEVMAGISDLHKAYPAPF